jgi:Protein of unknown function (DUF2971)
VATAPELHHAFFDALNAGTRTSFLHHYTSLDTALAYILPRQELRLNPFRNTNDPREYKDFSIRLAGIPVGTAVYEKVRRIAQGLLKDTWSLACLTMDNPQAGDHVSSWDRGWARSRMWAQYGHAHSGVCLVFDRGRMVEDVVAQLEAEGDAGHGPVAYLNSASLDAFVIDGSRIDPDNPLPAVINQLWGHRDTLLRQKLEDWETEYEYRFLLRREPEDGGTPGPFLADVRSSLRGIVLGHAVSAGYLPSIDALCETLQIGAARVDWNNGTPSLRDLGRP